MLIGLVLVNWFGLVLVWFNSQVNWFGFICWQFNQIHGDVIRLWMLATKKAALLIINNSFKKWPESSFWNPVYFSPHVQASRLRQSSL